MRILQIKPDIDCLSLLPSRPDFFDIAGFFQPQSKEPQWSTFGTEGPVFYPREPKPVLKGAFFDAVPGALAFDACVGNGPAGALLARCGEILPARLEGQLEPISILNVLTVYNCFDLERSKYRKAGTAVVQIFEHVFMPAEIGEISVFKAQVKQNTAIYTVADRGNEAGEFFYQYQNAGHTGLVFEEVWRD